MDPCQPRSVSRRPYSTGTSLVCIGGMLRVDSDSSDIPTSAQHRENPSKSKTTPFTALVSPFTACAPFTAPTTPFSSLTPAPHHHSPALTPCASLQLDSPASTPLLTPVSGNFFNHPDDTKPCSSGLGTECTNYLLTPKQVRELRRLCRKTANRAEFEDRLIQVRQVASISAMASSSVHLFDPDNPRSGHELRIWVETHRAQGADWRDERPLSHPAIDELRRWDRQLKAWARARLQNQPVYESTKYRLSGSIVATRNPHNNDSALEPIRLQFEQQSIETPPVTPLYVSKHSRQLERGDGGKTNIGLNPTTATNHIGASFQGPMTGDEVNGFAVNGAGVAEYLGSDSVEELRKPSGASPRIRSSWNQALLSHPCAIADGREPLTEVIINKKDDIINITVPASNKTPQPSGYIRQDVSGLFDTNGTAAFEKENLPNNRCDNSWGNSILRSTGARGRDIGGSVQSGSVNFGLNRMKSSREILSTVRPDVDAKGLGSPSKPELDWSALRGGLGLR